MIFVAPDPIDPPALLARFAAEQPQAGAIVSFVGQVRGDGVELLELEHHPTFTLKVLRQIGADAGDRFAISACAIVHRVGPIRPGEPIVFVAAASRHRRAAFDAVDYLMDRLKTEAPLWKRESRAGSASWIEARPADHADRQRWDSADAD